MTPKRRSSVFSLIFIVNCISKFNLIRIYLFAAKACGGKEEKENCVTSWLSGVGQVNIPCINNQILCIGLCACFAKPSVRRIDLLSL